MKFLKRTRIEPIDCREGDSIRLYSNGELILEETITEPHIFTEAAVFEIDGKKEYMLGGVFIETKNAE